MCGNIGLRVVVGARTRQSIILTLHHPLKSAFLFVQKTTKIANRKLADTRRRRGGVVSSSCRRGNLLLTIETNPQTNLHVVYPLRCNVI
jgi:hypothetical protein